MVPMRRTPLLVAPFALALALACTHHETPRSPGHLVVAGDTAALRASSDGAYLAYLSACRRVGDRTLPAGTASCDLSVVPAQGGPAVAVATGVSTLDGGFAWSRAGHVLAALGRYDYAASRGALVVWSGGEPRPLGEGVSFYAVAGDGDRVGWVSAGKLFVAESGGAPVPVAGAEQVATFEFGERQGLEMLARRSFRAGGALLAVHGHRAAVVAADVRDYGFGAKGRWFAFTGGAAQALIVEAADAPRSVLTLRRDVQTFLFSPRGDAVAFVADTAPGRQGNLWVAPLAGGAPVRLAERVGEPRWAAGGARLAWLEDYDPRSGAGTLAVGGPGVGREALARNVSDFDLTPDGGAVAYLVHDTAGGYSVDLGLATLGAGGERAQVARGVFGFSFSPDGAWLYYRSACVREAEACDLFRVPTRRGSTQTRAERIAEGVKSFEFAPGRSDRLLVTWARKDRAALDLAVWDRGKLSAVDTVALPGSAQFVGGDPTRVAYVVVDPKRAGVYVASVP